MRRGGTCLGLPVAATGTNLSPALAETVRLLTALDHRRIVLICPSRWRLPTLSKSAADFHAALIAHGIAASDYNLPSWEETADGLERRLESLFRFTPPTALILVEPLHCVTTLLFLARRGIQVPQDLSLVCVVTDPMLAWHRPALAVFVRPLQEHVHRVARWVDAVACGSPDHEQKIFFGTLDPGGSIGPAKKTGR